MWFVNLCKSNLKVKINISAVRGSCRCPKNKDQKYLRFRNTEQKCLVKI